MQKTESKQAEPKPLDKKAILKDTVDRTITLKLPRKLDEYLQGIAKVLGRSVDSVILEDAYSVFCNFFEGGYAEGWQEYIIGLNSSSVDGKSLDKQTDKIADVVLDC